VAHPPEAPDLLPDQLVVAGAGDARIDLHGLNLPERLGSLTRAVFERTSQTGSTAVEAAGFLVMGRVIDYPRQELHVVSLSPEGNLAVDVHSGHQCSSDCWSYVIDPTGVTNNNPRPPYGYLFGQPDPTVAREMAADHAEDELEALIEASMADPFSEYSWGSRRWTEYFLKHKSLPPQIVAAFGYATNLRAALPAA